MRPRPRELVPLPPKSTESHQKIVRVISSRKKGVGQTTRKETARSPIMQWGERWGLGEGGGGGSYAPKIIRAELTGLPARCDAQTGRL